MVLSFIDIKNRGGVLEDVLGLEDVLKDRFWSPWPWPRRSSPWPWPRGLKSSKIGLSSARGTALFFGKLKFCWSAWKIFWKAFFRGDRLKNFCEDLFFFFFFFFFGDRLKKFCEDLFFFFFLESTCALGVLGPWPWLSSIPVLGLESVCPRKGCPWPWPGIFFVSLALASSLVSSTPPLIKNQSLDFIGGLIF